MGQDDRFVGAMLAAPGGRWTTTVVWSSFRNRTPKTDRRGPMTRATTRLPVMPSVDAPLGRHRGRGTGGPMRGWDWPPGSGTGRTRSAGAAASGPAPARSVCPIPSVSRPRPSRNANWPRAPLLTRPVVAPTRHRAAHRRGAPSLPSPRQFRLHRRIPIPVRCAHHHNVGKE